MTITFGSHSITLHKPQLGAAIWLALCVLTIIMVIVGSVVLETKVATATSAHAAAAPDILVNEAPELHELLTPDE